VTCPWTSLQTGPPVPAGVWSVFVGPLTARKYHSDSPSYVLAVESLNPDQRLGSPESMALAVAPDDDYGTRILFSLLGFHFQVLTLPVKSRSGTLDRTRYLLTLVVGPRRLRSACFTCPPPKTMSVSEPSKEEANLAAQRIDPKRHRSGNLRLNNDSTSSNERPGRMDGSRTFESGTKNQAPSYVVLPY
jgi:hypothetical protein